MIIINNRELELPIEYYGLQESNCPCYIEIERNIKLKDKVIDEILRVYVDIELGFEVKSNRIDDIEKKLTCYMFDLNLNIEYLDRKSKKELSIFQISIPEYSYILEEVGDYNINPKISDVYVCKQSDDSIYFYSTVKLY